MTIQQLHYFLTLCQELNYSHAAARLYLSRQALRQSIQALEQELCSPLFANDHNHLSLTQKGQQLRDLAAPVVEQFDQMCQKARRHLVTHPVIRLGISQALVPDYLPSLGDYLDQFRQAYPGIPLETIIEPNDQTVHQLLAGQRDAVLVMDLGRAPSHTLRRPLTVHAFALMVGHNSPYWNRASLCPRELEGAQMLTPGLDEWITRPMQDLFAADGVSITLQLAVSFYQAIYAMQEYGAVGFTRLEQSHITDTDNVREVKLEGMPSLYASFLTREAPPDPCLDLLYHILLDQRNQNL